MWQNYKRYIPKRLYLESGTTKTRKWWHKVSSRIPHGDHYQDTIVSAVFFRAFFTKVTDGKLRGIILPIKLFVERIVCPSKCRWWWDFVENCSCHVNNNELVCSRLQENMLPISVRSIRWMKSVIIKYVPNFCLSCHFTRMFNGMLSTFFFVNA
jgi:hypothetical protein